MNNSLRILFVEDSEDDVLLMLRLFKQAGHEVRSERVQTEGTMDAALSKEPWDIVISDYAMPEFSGLAALRVLQRSGKEIPFIIVSGKMGEAIAVEAIKTGAQDYLVKHDLTRLVIAVEQAIKSVEDRLARKKAEQRLQESEERFHALFEKAPVGYQSLDENGCFIEVNQTYSEILGYSREELIGKWFGDLLVPEFVDAFRQRFPLFKAQGHIHSEFEMLHKDGSRHFVAFEGRIGYKLDGTFMQTHCVLSDITERRKATEALRKSQKLLAEVGEIGKVGGWEFNIDTLEQIWTKETYLIHELDMDDNPTVEQGINFYTASSKPVIERLVQRAIEHGESYDVDLDIITAKGNLRHVHAIGKADLAHRRIYGFFQDITERKKHEAALQQSEQRFKSIVNASPSGMYLYDLVEDGRLIFMGANPAADKIIGVDHVALIGKTIEEAFPGLAKTNLPARYKQVALDGVPWHIEQFDYDEGVIRGVYEVDAFQTEPRKVAVAFSDISQRKQAEEAIKKEQVLNNTIIESIPGTFYMLDENGRYVRWNAYQRDEIVGRKDDQMPDMLAADTIHPDDREYVVSKIRNVLKNGTMEAVEGRVLMHGGPEFKWLLMTGRQILVEGKPCLVGIGIDITALKHVEDSLRRSQQIIEGIINAIPVRVFWKDRDLVYRGCNTIFAQDSGFADQKDMIGKDDFQMKWHDQAELYRKDDRQVIESGCPKLHIEEIQTTPDGRTINLLTSKQPLYDATGEIVGVLGTYIDITERKRMEEKLAASQRQLADVINTVADPIFVKDREHRWIVFNQAFCAFIGRSADELNGKSDYDFFPKEEADVFWAKDEEVFRGRMENVNEEFFTDGKGVRRTILTKKTLYKDVDGHDILVGIIQDMTEQKKAEAALRKHAQEMEVFYKASFGREERILELKKQVGELEKKLTNQGPRS